MASTAKLDSLSKEFECSICLDILTNPKELCCPHAFCKECLDDMVVFKRDGEGLITCALCKEETVIRKSKTTNDLRTSVYLRNMAERFNDKRLANESERCGKTGCGNVISVFCTRCKLFLCGNCGHAEHRNHNKSAISISKDRELKVECKEHQTPCNYICCEHELTCIYCVHRRHSAHYFKPLKKHIEHLREKLQKEIKRYETTPKIFDSTWRDIKSKKEEFETCLKYRKMNCLFEYKLLLQQEEDELRREFNEICEQHLNDNNILHNVHSLKEFSSLTDIHLALNEEIILETIALTRCPSVRPIRTVSMSESNFMSPHPLGKVDVTLERIAGIDLEEQPTFMFNAPESKDATELPQLLKNLQEFAREVESSTGAVDADDSEASSPANRPSAACEKSITEKERLVVDVRASVTIFNNETKKWQQAGTSSGICCVQIWYNPKNKTYRVAARRIKDSKVSISVEVVLNCWLSKHVVYSKVTDTFHRWEFQDRRVYGLQFQSLEHATAFSKAFLYTTEKMRNPSKDCQRKR